MKNSLDFVHGFPEFAKLKQSHISHICKEPEYDKRDNAMLDLIYAPDPVTALPKGDFAIYLGDKTSPEVREFVRANLLREMPNAPALPDNVSDELFEYIRKNDESVSSYISRISALVNSKKEVVEDKKVD